jgi:hypothetical protein
MIGDFLKHQRFENIKHCRYFQVYFSTQSEQTNLIAVQRSDGVSLLETD